MKVKPEIERSYHHQLHLMHALVCFSVAVFITCLTPCRSLAQDEAPVSEPDTPSIFSSLKVKLANGVVDTVNKSKRADVQLQWKVLPLGTQTREQAGRDKIVPVEFAFSNADLATRKFVTDITNGSSGVTDAERLSGAIGGRGFDLDRWHTAFQAYWKLSNPVVAQLLQDQTLTVRQYIGLLHDHDIMYTLLKSNGFDFELRVADEDVTVRNLPDVIKNSRWRISQYKFKIAEGSGSPASSTHIYRYSVSLDAPRFTLVFPQGTEDKVKLEARAKWVAPTGEEASDIWKLGVTETGFRFQDIEIAPDEVVKDKLDTIEEDNGGPSRFETQLTTFTGASLGDIVTKNLLGGGKNVSIVSGGLVSKNSLKPSIGLNLEFGQPSAVAQPGFLFGVETGGGDALYTGPSLRAGIFTFSVGTRFATEDRAERNPSGSGTFIKGDFAGFIALDLSRLLGGKRTTTALKLNQETFGGDLGLSSDEVANNLGGLITTLTISQGAKLKRGDLRLRRVEDEEGNEIKAGAVVSIDPKQGDRLLFLASGRYRWETRFGKEITVKAQGETIKDGDFGPSITSDDPFIRLNIEVGKTPP